MPPRLFRFLPKGAKAFLDDRKLWFSNIVDFNDPFDATPSLAEIVDQMYKQFLHEHSRGRPIPEEFQRFAKHDKAQVIPILTQFLQEKFGDCFGVLCFAERNDFVPMWGHYASNHEGFVLEFNSRHALFTDQNFGPVIYSSKRPQLAPKLNQSLQECNERILTKSTDWDKESEWRLIKVWSNLKQAPQPWNNKPGRYLDLPPDVVRAVYFGCRVSKDLTDQIERSCQCQDYREVKLFQMVPDVADYKFNPIPWTGYKHTIPNTERPVLEDEWHKWSTDYNVPVADSTKTSPIT